MVRVKEGKMNKLRFEQTSEWWDSIIYKEGKMDIKEIDLKAQEVVKTIEPLLSQIKELTESRDFWKRDSQLEQAHSIQCEKRVKELEKTIDIAEDNFIKSNDRIKELEEGIKELLAYGMPYHIEDGLIKLVEKESK
jgi:chromosome segregation ATPase